MTNALTPRPKKIMFILGTRPEAIKMAPVIRTFRRHKDTYHVIVVVTAQHRDMLDQILKLFEIVPNHDLDIMKDNQSIHDVTARCLKKLLGIIAEEKPDMVLVQGDTTSTFIGALSAFYMKIPVAHIEAGLRSFDKYNPFPEEMNRRMTTVLADLHFAPTGTAAANLAHEGISTDRIFITGNTVIDALLEVVRKRFVFPPHLDSLIKSSQKIILVTAHRRESFGEPLKNVCRALQEIVRHTPSCRILFPVHPNPEVKKTVYAMLDNTPNIALLSPLDYETFVHVINKSHLILTDSGGIQEEAPSLGKPVLVLRNKTERIEAIEAGTAKMVGTDFATIVRETLNLLSNADEYEAMAKKANPYGDGKASQKIYDIISRWLA